MAFLALFFGVGLLSPTPAFAEIEASSSFQSQSQDETRPEDGFKYSFTTGLPLIAGGVASVVVPSLMYKTPPPCRWCNGATPNAIDTWARKAKWSDPCRAASISYKTMGAAAAIALLPMSRESNAKEWLVNSGAIVNSVAVTVMLTQVVKYAVRRERPSPGICHPDRTIEPDRNMSFFSGHTSVAVALIASAHEVSRQRGRPRNEWLVAGGLSAAVTGYLRVAGDRHHLVDVLTGAGVGYLVGTWVPRHFHKTAVPTEPQPRAGPQTSMPMSGYVWAVDRGERPMMIQLGTGPGKRFQLGITF